MKKVCYSLIVFFFALIIVSCKPSTLEVEVYTSDIESASDGEIVEVPIKATFSLMGEDKENQLPEAKTKALKYMPSDSEIEISKGTFGKVMTIVSTIPLGNSSSLKKFLQQNPRIAMVVFEKGMVKLQPTETIEKLDKELSKINFMLGLELPAKNTSFRVVSDSKKKVKITATAVFSEKKPYLHFSKDLKRRKSVVIDFKGGDESVYSEIAPHFSAKF